MKKQIYSTTGLWSLGLALLLTAGPATQAQLVVTDVGRYDFTDTSGSGARELSGITPIGFGSSGYYAIGDQDALLHTLSINVDSSSGQVTAASIGASPTTLTTITASPLAPGDREAIAVQGANIIIANESGPKLEAYNPTTGYQTGSPITTAQPGLGVYNNVRGNRAWESLAVYPTHSDVMLTANEDALTVDGPAADFTNGAVVRVQAAFVDASNSTADAIGQFAYNTDPINGNNPLVTSETSGLVELMILPDNRVLAMERAVGLSGYRIRLYEVNGQNATDVSGLSGLAGLTPGVDYTPLGKTLLWENTFSPFTNSNFEGITLGPTLDDGEISLILIADNASGPSLPLVGQQWTAQDQSLYALTLDEPAASCWPNGCLDGDLDHTGFVGLEDLDIILQRWNDTVLPGIGSDPTVDGFVGLEDLDIVLSNWNAGTPPLDPDTSIPEPATSLLLSLLCLMSLKRRATHA